MLASRYRTPVPVLQAIMTIDDYLAALAYIEIEHDNRLKAAKQAENEENQESQNDTPRAPEVAQEVSPAELMGIFRYAKKTVLGQELDNAK